MPGSSRVSGRLRGAGLTRLEDCVARFLGWHDLGDVESVWASLEFRLLGRALKRVDWERVRELIETVDQEVV